MNLERIRKALQLAAEEAVECVNTPDAPDFKPGPHTKCVYCECQQALQELPTAPEPLSPAEVEAPDIRSLLHGPSFQWRVVQWVRACLPPSCLADRTERALRFAEEAVELVQASGVPREKVDDVVAYVYARPPEPDPAVEVGGSLVTLAALAHNHGVKLDECGEAELKRCEENIEKIRRKHMERHHRGVVSSDFPTAPAVAPAPESPVCDCGKIEHGRHHQDCPVTLARIAKEKARKAAPAPAGDAAGECNHLRTYLVDHPDEPGLKTVEICHDCGMSRHHWEQGSTEWKRIDLTTLFRPVEGRTAPASPRPWAVASFSDRVEITCPIGLVLVSGLPVSPDAARIIQDFAAIAEAVNASAPVPPRAAPPDADLTRKGLPAAAQRVVDIFTMTDAEYVAKYPGVMPGTDAALAGLREAIAAPPPDGGLAEAVKRLADYCELPDADYRKKYPDHTLDGPVGDERNRLASALRAAALAGATPAEGDQRNGGA